jgi:hypothetical protein
MEWEIFMKKRLMLNTIMAAVLLLLYACPSPGGGSGDIVTSTDMNTHYRVVIEASGRSHYEIGQDYARKTQQTLNDWEKLVDSYIEYITAGDDVFYGTLIGRTYDIRNQIPVDYVNEIEGFYSMLSGTAVNEMGDDKVSKDEMYLINLLPDVGRWTQCSAVSVFGNLSATNSTITGRILDWIEGDDHQFPRLQAVTVIKDGPKSVCLIGCLGFMGAISACNDNGVFAAILDSATGGVYSSVDKNSYPFDIRYALETYSSLDEVANYLTFADRDYTFGHLVFLSDATASKVVENDMSEDSHRLVRVYDSTLNAAVTDWPPVLDFSMGAVNSFVLNGNTDNHSGEEYNEDRWASIITELTNRVGGEITVMEFKEVISFDNGDGPGSMWDGDIYNNSTQQCIVFQPGTMDLEIYFRARDGSLADDPVFETIELNF